MDLMVAKTQDWLHAKYSRFSWFPDDVPVEGDAKYGKTGWHTIYALLRALQHELGIDYPTNTFGPTTTQKYEANMLRPGNEPCRMNAILQGALWCKGYDPGHYASDNKGGMLDDSFDEKVARAVRQLKSDAYNEDITDATVTVNVMKALMSMDQFVLLSSYGGDAFIRRWQQSLNKKYESYTGLMPCDGVYGRGTNKALIYAIQAMEGIPAASSTGTFGPSTKRCIPRLPYDNVALNYQGRTYNSVQILEFTELMQFALYCNGYGDGTTSGIYQQPTADLVASFQRFYALEPTGICDLSTWLSILTSCGDADRPAQALDCATILSQQHIDLIKANGYHTVGRYLTGTANGVSKALSRRELNLIVDNGLRYFCIYQERHRANENFNNYEGQQSARAAIETARYLGVPDGAVIYFAVDYDAIDAEVTQYIIPYFEGIRAYCNNNENPYRIGIYGSRNICSRVAAKGLSVSSFVGDMSTGYSGNLGFPIPQDWAFDQFANITLVNNDPLYYLRLEIDKNAMSGSYVGESHVTEPAEPPTEGEEPYTAPPPVASEGKQAGGYSGFYVNRASVPVPVYGTIINSPYAHPANQIGEIPVNDFYSRIDMRQPNVWTIHWCVVWFRNAEGLMERGYVDTGTNPEDPDEYREFADAIFKSQRYFSHFRVGDVNAADPLRPSDRDNPDDFRNGKYIFTLATNAHIFNGSTYIGELHIGDKITMNEKPDIGATRPWNLAFFEKKIGDGEWQVAVPGQAFGWIDMRIPYGVSPARRLLV